MIVFYPVLLQCGCHSQLLLVIEREHQSRQTIAGSNDNLHSKRSEKERSSVVTFGMLLTSDFNSTSNRFCR